MKIRFNTGFAGTYASFKSGDKVDWSDVDEARRLCNAGLATALEPFPKDDARDDDAAAGPADDEAGPAGGDDGQASQTNDESDAEAGDGEDETTEAGDGDEGSEKGEGEESSEPEDGDEEAGSGEGEGIDATDSAAELAKEAGLDLASIKGTGVGGRILLNDVRDAITAAGE